jgi:type IV pilus assembly protein PilQ
MRLVKLIFILTAISLVFACAKKETIAPVKKEPQILIKTVQLDKIESGRYKLIIEGNGNIDYEVFYSKHPYKIIVMANGAKVNPDLLKYKYSDDVVEDVAIYPAKGRTNIEIILNDNIDYTYDKTLNSLNINFNVIDSDVNVLSSGVDTKDVNAVDLLKGKFLKSAVNASTNSKLFMKFQVDGIVRYDYGFLNDKKLYLDIFNVTNKIKRKRFKGNGIVRSFQIDSYYPPQKTRILINLANPVPVFVSQTGKEILVSSELSDIPQEEKYIVGFQTISVKKNQSVIIQTTSKVSYDKKIINGNLIVQLKGNVKLLKSVNNIFTYQNMPFKKVKLAEVEGKLSVIVIPNGDIYAKVDTIPEGLLISGSFDEFSAADYKLDTAVTEKTTVKKNKYIDTSKEDLISLNIKDLDVQEAIRLIYFGRNKNIVFGNGVKGKVTLYVKNLPYRQALDVIYKENNIVEMEEQNGLVWIISKNRYNKIQQEKINKVKQQQAQKALEPLITEIIPVNYGSAKDFESVLRTLKTGRGKMQIETRSNSFVVTDTAEAIKKMKETLKQVDKRTPQVTIEARIVEVLDSNDLNLGIQWGGQYQTTADRYFPQNVNMIGNTGATGPSGNGGYAVNLPVANPAGALAMTLGTLMNDLTIDVALSALETRNKTKTISSPKVTTMDNEEAEIKSGGSAIIVPTGDNTQAETVDTGIKLKVTPHITNNDMVVMEIEVEKSSLGAVTANNVTTMEKKAKTQVLLADGETTVLGGIYENETVKITEGVPYLQDIPLLGWLFKKKTDQYTKKELLVFITPKIVR